MYTIKELKPLLDLNQNLKLIYSNWVILGNFIVGIPIKNSEGIYKEKFRKSFYKTSILEKLPDINYYSFDSSMLYKLYKDRKKYKDIMLEDNIIKVDLENEIINIGKALITDKDREKAVKMLNLLIDEFQMFLNDEETLEIDEESITELIEYKMVKPCMYNNIKYSMYVTISEFPLLKKMRKLKIHGNKECEQEDCFDVVYETYDETDSFFMKRRFIKMI